MKKLIIILALLPVLFLGCSKSLPDKPEPEEQKFKVQFTANVININVSPIGMQASTVKSSSTNYSDLLNEGVNFIDFIIYDRNDNVVGAKSKNLFDSEGNVQSDAMKFDVELPKGDYTIGVLARSANSEFYRDQKKEISFISFPVTKLADKEIVQFTPVYIHKYSSFKVEDEAVSNQIQLNRLNAQLELNIQDEIPSNVRYLFFGGNISRFIHPFNIFTNAAGGKSLISFDLNSVRNEGVKVLRLPFYPEYFSTTDQQRVKNYDVLLYDKDFKYLGTKTIENIYFKENHITRLKGKFFDTLDGGNKSTAITVDFLQQYNSNIIETTF